MGLVLSRTLRQIELAVVGLLESQDSRRALRTDNAKAFLDYFGAHSRLSVELGEKRPKCYSLND